MNNSLFPFNKTNGLCKTTLFRDFPSAEVDKFVKARGLHLQRAWEELLKRQFQDFSSCHRIPVNYDEQYAIAKAIEEAMFGVEDIKLPLVDIPLIGTGFTEHEIHEVPFGKTMHNDELRNALKERGKELGYANGFEFADPLTALRYACALPDRQRKYSIVILFNNANGRLWHLCLGMFFSKRSLSIHPNILNLSWDQNTIFLAV